MYPTLLALGPIAISSLWFVMSVGSVVSLIVFFKTSQYRRLSLELIFKHQWILIISSIIGARLAFILINFEFYFPLTHWTQILRFFTLWDHNLSFWGGLAAFLLTFSLYVLKEDLANLKKWYDAMTFPFLILMAFSSLGDFFEGENYGRETDLPWGLIFDNFNVQYTVPIHPTQLYLCLLTIILMIALKYYQKTWAFLKTDGVLALIGLSLYFNLRFLIEFLQGDETITIIGLRLSQIIYSLIFVSGYYFLYKEYKKYQNPSPEVKAETPTENNDTSTKLENHLSNPELNNENLNAKS